MQIPLAFIIFIIFLVLKLTDVIAWSWWWITSPLWIGAGFSILFLLFTSSIVAVAARKVNR